MEIDLTGVVENSARDRWNEQAQTFNDKLDAGLVEGERSPMWDDLKPINQSIMRENEMFWLKFLLPHLTEAIVAPIRAKIEDNELTDPDDGEFIAQGLIETDALRVLIGEPR